ncbi:MAG: hypothetical protein SFT94_06775 [Pseudanabaenaceae cyanobacterium bins.68]|nr:hypothetical protein [Pseudanabaenaceae cyanobacterium bins.68]
MDELLAVLELATDQELEQIAEILFRRKFNPLDYFRTPTVSELRCLDRQELLIKLADRFCFLAADGLAVLKGNTKSVSYRQVLERVCVHLKIKFTSDQAIASLESELFLHLLSQAWEKLPPPQRDRLHQLVTQDQVQAVAGASNPLALVLKGSSAIAVSTIVRPTVLNLLAKQLAWHLATYQASKAALQVGSNAIANRVQAYLAHRGIVAVAARYGLARTAFAVITPTLWGIFLADLGWRAIAVNYSRVIPVLFTLAQIRLLRG